MFIDLFNRFSITLPIRLVEELETHSKQQKDQKYFLRLMEFDEIIETADFMSEMEVYQDIIPLWTDDHSNYIGLHFQGACKYRISYINHEETDLSPSFRSISSFITKLEQHPNLDWDELKKDYPSEIEFSNTELAEDSICIEELNKLISSNELINDDVRCQYIFSIMALTPKRDLDSLIKYLDDEDMYVQERACEIIGFHRYIPAKEKLTEVSKNGMHNGKLAATIALSRIREHERT
ncbi:HEAT repeat domain-containing protein [Paenibacillus sp. ACRRX]|uniref:HEAT repeat domain-containing protein n=1 Tax=Paenibacillus sp. ACRRX TaxID=2918206 RepID=UPI001EF48669|nr:HEAT repeat domain-containing protein [Paenibacillus sp. ACRRX]MCG7409428.1 HEAT repeat domain-containing protein [Paenibacillus sp. ACRRX]